MLNIIYMKESILVTGANGQIGSVLIPKLQGIYGYDNVIASDLYENLNNDGIFEIIDANDIKRLQEVVVKYNVTQIYHLAAILSAKGEENPLSTWNINMSTLMNILETGRLFQINKIFFPSSIAVFGNSAEKTNTPQSSFLDPETVYGISKAAGENWIQYYSLKYNMDIRSLRYPGIISYQSLPGGGTTDYAVDIFHKAVQGETYTCFLKEDTKLPMMYIDDALRGTLEFMEAPKASIKTKTSYNLAGVSFAPKDVVDSIRTHIPDFKIIYKPDARQLIADKWPKSINDEEARIDWNWNHNYDLKSITEIMLTQLKEKYYKIEVS